MLLVLFCFLSWYHHLFAACWHLLWLTCRNFPLTDILLASAEVADERHPAAGLGAAPLACSCRHKNQFIIEVLRSSKNLFWQFLFLGRRRILMARNCSSVNCTLDRFVRPPTDHSVNLIKAVDWSVQEQLSSCVSGLRRSLESCDRSHRLSARAGLGVISSRFCEGGLNLMREYTNDCSCVFFCFCFQHLHFSSSNFQSVLLLKGSFANNWARMKFVSQTKDSEINQSNIKACLLLYKLCTNCSQPWVNEQNEHTAPFK